MKTYSDRKFRYANKEVAYTRLRHTDSKSVKENQENIQAAQDERDKYNNEKLSAYRAYRSEQNTYKLKKARLGEDENSDEAIAIDNAISELDTKKKAALNSMKLTIQEHTDLLDQIEKEDNEVEEKVNRQISIIKGHESILPAKTSCGIERQALACDISYQGRGRRSVFDPQRIFRFHQHGNRY